MPLSLAARLTGASRFESNCSGTNESGTVYVRVKKNLAPRGDSYDLYVEAK